MRIEPVEIYSDASNAAVMRHPDRRFPGVLIQADTLASLVKRIDAILVEANGREEAREDLADVSAHLKALLQHYQNVLISHSIELPFHERGYS